MRVREFIIIALLAMLLIGACTLKRSNPLDPEGNPNIIVPEVVTGLNASVTTNKLVALSWESVAHPHRYNIYRCLSYDGQYQFIDTTGVILDTQGNMIDEGKTYTDNDVVVGEKYYYKVSAVNAEGLEGSLSAWKYVKVQ